MTQVDSAVSPTVVQRWRSARWVILALVVIAAVGALGTYLTAPRPGGRMDRSRRRRRAREPWCRCCVTMVST